MLTTVAIVVFAVIFAFILLQNFVLMRARSQRGRSVEADVVRKLRLKKGRPALLYFTSPTCSMCRIQEQEMAGWKPREIQFVKVNVAEHLEVAQYFKIMGTPSFVLLDENRRIREVLVGRQPLNRLENLVPA